MTFEQFIETGKTLALFAAPFGAAWTIWIQARSSKKAKDAEAAASAAHAKVEEKVEETKIVIEGWRTMVQQQGEQITNLHRDHGQQLNDLRADNREMRLKLDECEQHRGELVARLAEAGLFGRRTDDPK